MIVLDASALVELVLHTESGRAVAQWIASPREDLHIPHLADLEVLQVMRRLTRTGEINAAVAEAALATYLALDLVRHPHQPLFSRIWGHRHNCSAYDAAYVVLAEVLDCSLLTCDAALARAPGIRVRLCRPS